MASLTLADMAEFVRTVLDSDEEEMPDVMLDVWRDEGVARIERTFENWSFYEQTWDLTTSDHAVTLPDDLETISSIEAANWTLQYLPHAAAINQYAYGDQTGLPYFWSLWAGVLYLWPTPSDEVSYTVTGIRKPIEATADTDTVDLPDEFHALVCEWMLARAYEQQDDDIMSTQKFGRFEQELDGYRRRYLRAPSAGLQVVGGICPSTAYKTSDRMRFDWEGNI